jgi:hypothetical protein
MSWAYHSYIVDPGDETVKVEHIFYGETKDDCIEGFNAHLRECDYFRPAAGEGRTDEVWEQLKELPTIDLEDEDNQDDEDQDAGDHFVETFTNRVAGQNMAWALAVYFAGKSGRTVDLAHVFYGLTRAECRDYFREHCESCAYFKKVVDEKHYAEDWEALLASELPSANRIK